MKDTTWKEAEEPELESPGLTGIVRAVLRGVPLAVLVFGGLLLLLAIRLIERPLSGMNRPVTPHLTVFVCRNAFRILGMGYCVHGTPLQGRGAMVANHSSWLDIFSLNAAVPLYFVSKAGVAGWPGIGWLARATGTVFIERKATQAKAQKSLFETRLLAGHRLLFFPEGTSTDGLQVQPFKSTLFAAFFADTLRDVTEIQPVSVVYQAPDGQSERFYGWWGDMEFAPHLLHTLAARRQGRVEVMYHTPLRTADFADRKALATRAEELVRKGHDQMRNPSCKSGEPAV